MSVVAHVIRRPHEHHSFTVRDVPTRPRWSVPSARVPDLIGGQSAVLPSPDLYRVPKRVDQREAAVARRSFGPAAGDAFLADLSRPEGYEVVAVSAGEGSVVGQAPAREKGVAYESDLFRDAVARTPYGVDRGHGVSALVLVTPSRRGRAKNHA